jgi:hypothetical protein
MRMWYMIRGGSGEWKRISPVNGGSESKAPNNRDSNHNSFVSRIKRPNHKWTNTTNHSNWSVWDVPTFAYLHKHTHTSRTNFFSIDLVGFIFCDVV